MEITKQFNWLRRDFCYEAKCEHCGNTSTHSGGYDDSYYYTEVIPNQKCDNCGESSNSKQIEGKPKTVVIPKYDPNQTI